MDRRALVRRIAVYFGIGAAGQPGPTVVRVLNALVVAVSLALLVSRHVTAGLIVLGLGQSVLLAGEWLRRRSSKSSGGWEP